MHDVRCSMHPAESISQYVSIGWLALAVHVTKSLKFITNSPAQVKASTVVTQLFHLTT